MSVKPFGNPIETRPEMAPDIIRHATSFRRNGSFARHFAGFPGSLVSIRVESHINLCISLEIIKVSSDTGGIARILYLGTVLGDGEVEKRCDWHWIPVQMRVRLRRGEGGRLKFGFGTIGMPPRPRVWWRKTLCFYTALADARRKWSDAPGNVVKYNFPYRFPYFPRRILWIIMIFWEFRKSFRSFLGERMAQAR